VTNSARQSKNPAKSDISIKLTTMDEEVILFVNGYRSDHGRGPTWSEVRQAVGVPPIIFNQRVFAGWWEEHQDEFEAQHPFEAYRQVHPDLDEEAAAKRWRREGHKAWIARQRRHDPLANRLFLLRQAGYLIFTREERSLDIGPQVRAWQQT
jgi:hypothetical protein